MSRKILKIGSDILTLNDKLVSVREDYPFWKVNLDTSEQYWNAFDNANTSVPYTISIENNIVNPIIGNGSVGFVTCDGINHYSIPSSDTAIKKFNSETGQLTYIGSFSGSWKFSGAIPGGKYIYFIPRDFTSVIKLDTELDTFISIGSFVGVNKWGKPILIPDGRIIAPRVTTTTVFSLDTSDDTVTLITATNLQTNDSFEAGTWYYNGFVYAIRGAGGDSGRLFKIDVSNNTQSVISFNFGSSIFQNTIVYKNLTFIFSTNAINIYDNITNSFLSALPKSSGISASGSVIYGSDGWIYQFSSNLLGNNTRFNPKNFTVETLFTNPNASGNHNFNALCGKNGKIYILNGTTLTVTLLNSTTSENINPNQLLNRNINKV